MSSPNDALPTADPDLVLASDVGGIPLSAGLGATGPNTGVVEPPPPATLAASKRGGGKRKKKAVNLNPVSSDGDEPTLGDEPTEPTGKRRKSKKSKTIPPCPHFDYDAIKVAPNNIIDKHGFNLNTYFSVEQCPEDKNFKEWKTEENDRFLVAGYTVYHAAPGYKRDVFLELTLRFLERFPKRQQGFKYNRETIVEDFFCTTQDGDGPAPWSDAQHWHLLLWLKV
jgi:hypothetical protein